jgi:hypothetical protein
MSERTHRPFPLNPEVTRPLVARQFVIARYEAFVDATDLKPGQKSVYKTQFERLAIVTDRDFRVEEEARARGEPQANTGYHNRWHLWQTAHDDINAAYVLAERGSVPLYLAMELPQDGLGHDWGYMGQLSDKCPTYADRIWIHVEKSILKLVRFRQDRDFPTFYTDREKEMSLWGTILATHATHFRDKETMERLQRAREKLVDMFVGKFADGTDNDYWFKTAHSLVDAAQFGDLGGQVAAPYYMRVLPYLRVELNAATPPGEPPKGDSMIGITPEEMAKKTSGFVQFVIIGGKVYQTAQDLFGPGNDYEKAWRSLIIS